MMRNAISGGFLLQIYCCDKRAVQYLTTFAAQSATKVCGDETVRRVTNGSLIDKRHFLRLPEWELDKMKLN